MIPKAPAGGPMYPPIFVANNHGAQWAQGNFGEKTQNFLMVKKKTRSGVAAPGLSLRSETGNYQFSARTSKYA